MNLQTLFAENHVDFKLGGTHPHVRHGWIGLDCCYCGPGSHSYHLGVNLESLYAVCWRCGYHRLGDVLSQVLGISVGEALRLMGDVERTKTPVKEQRRGKLVVPPVGPLMEAHEDYLRRRGFDPAKIVQLWGVRGIGIARQLSWRLWIPVHRHGEVVSWTTRSIGDHSSRYLSATPDQEAVPLKHLLYGADFAGHGVIICEGPIDVWAIGPGAVATCGLQYTVQQLEALGRFTVRAICFDSEPAAQGRARQLARQLAPYHGETVVIELETGGDPAEVDPVEIENLRKQFL